MEKMYGSAGFFASDDAQVTVEIGAEKKGIEIKSKVSKLFNAQIEGAVKDILDKFNIKDAYVLIEDRGALDYVLRARIEAAVIRALASRKEGDEV